MKKKTLFFYEYTYSNVNNLSKTHAEKNLAPNF